MFLNPCSILSLWSFQKQILGLGLDAINKIIYNKIIMKIVKTIDNGKIQ